jgi:hypothetical protein
LSTETLLRRNFHARPPDIPAEMPGVSRAKVQSYLAPALHRRVRAFAAAQGSSESAVVQAALLEYLDRDIKDSVLLMRRLDRVARAAARLDRDLGILSEAFAVFVQVWFAHTAEISEAERDPATRSGLSRYRRFVEHVAAKLAVGERLVRDVVKEDPAADLTELSAAAPPDPGAKRA